MKFVTLASLATLTSAETVGSPNTATGGLNYIWTDEYMCKDFSNADNLVEILSGSTTSNSTFSAFKQECAEMAYGLSAEYAPCVGSIYLPAGMPTLYGDGPFYSCRAFSSDKLDKMDE